MKIKYLDCEMTIKSFKLEKFKDQVACKSCTENLINNNKTKPLIQHLLLAISILKNQMRKIQ